MRTYSQELTYEELLTKTITVLRVSKLGECFEWQGAMSDKYGGQSYHGVFWRVHRLAWFLVNGEIPGGLNVLHQCDNRLCINVLHLFLGTSRDNAEDCVAKGRHPNAVKTHCLRGHEYTPENTGHNNAGRFCKTCQRESARKYYLRKRENL